MTESVPRLSLVPAAAPGAPAATGAGGEGDAGSLGQRDDDELTLLARGGMTREGAS